MGASLITDADLAYFHSGYVTRTEAFSLDCESCPVGKPEFPHIICTAPEFSDRFAFEILAGWSPMTMFSTVDISSFTAAHELPSFVSDELLPRAAK